MAILQIQSKKSEVANFTRIIEENKFKFYKTAKIILKNDDDEHYCRKATIKLGENKIIVNIEDCDGEELSKNIQQDISDLMGGASAYIPRGDLVYYRK